MLYKYKMRRQLVSWENKKKALEIMVFLKEIMTLLVHL